MNRKNIKILSLVFILIIAVSSHDKFFLNAQPVKTEKIPHLKKQGNITQLIVEGKLFIVLGGELGNSTFTSVEYMTLVWSKLKAMNLNTVLAPVYWEIIEPAEGDFDLTEIVNMAFTIIQPPVIILFQLN